MASRWKEKRGLAPIVCGLPGELLDVFCDSHIVKFGQTLVHLDWVVLASSDSQRRPT